MNRTRVIFITIVGVAILIVAISLALRGFGTQSTDAGLTVDKPASVTVRILCALPVEPWVRNAADAFNKGNNSVDGVPVKVEIEAVDGLTALSHWDRNDYSALAGRYRSSHAERSRPRETGQFPHGLDS